VWRTCDALGTGVCRVTKLGRGKGSGSVSVYRRPRTLTRRDYLLPGRAVISSWQQYDAWHRAVAPVIGERS
jgi:hypothetical protein